MAETRKLVAILAADVAGYSKLAGSDEEPVLMRGNVTLSRNSGRAVWPCPNSCKLVRAFRGKTPEAMTVDSFG